MSFSVSLKPQTCPFMRDSIHLMYNTVQKAYACVKKAGKQRCPEKYSFEMFVQKIEAKSLYTPRLKAFKLNSICFLCLVYLISITGTVISQ